MDSFKLLVRVTFFASLCLISSAQLPVSYPEINLPGIVIPDIDAVLEDNPKPCCLPKQWQGNITSQSGWTVHRARGDVDKKRGRKGGFRSYTATVYVDENKKKVAGRIACRNDTCGSIVVFGSNNTADYYLFTIKSQKCWHNKSHAEFRKQCLPDNATFEGSSKLGPAAGGLGVQLWRFHGKPNHRSNPRPEIYVAGRAVVTEANCVPVVVQEVGAFRSKPGPHQDNNVEFDMEQDEFDEDFERPHPKGYAGYFMGSSYFSNFEASVKDPKVFDPPSYCKSLIGGSLPEDMEYPDFIDRFVVFK